MCSTSGVHHLFLEMLHIFTPLSLVHMGVDTLHCRVTSYISPASRFSDGNEYARPLFRL